MDICVRTATSQENRHGVGLLAWAAGGGEERESTAMAATPFLLFNTFMVASSWTKSVCVCVDVWGVL